MGDKGFTKSDMDRIGLFQEMEYATIGDRFQSNKRLEFNDAAGKGKQMLPGGSKSKTAGQGGYFSDTFGRVLEGEAYTDPVKLRRQYRLQENKKNIGKPFLPSSGDKKPSGLGNHYGTLSGPISAFSPSARPGKEYKSSGKNVLTNPGKKGTGFGYVGVTINPYAKHLPDQYDRTNDIVRKENADHRQKLKGGAFRLNMHARSYFDENPFKNEHPLPPVRSTDGPKNDFKPFKPSSPAKVPAGMKAGTFDPYPSHSSDPYGIKYRRPVHVVNKFGKTFMPSAGPKTRPITSIVSQNVLRTMNSTNYRTLSTVMSA